MRPARVLGFTMMNVRRDLRSFVLSAAGVSVGVAAFVYFVGLGGGVNRVVREEIFPVDARHVRVIPQRVALGSFLGGGVLDEEAVERLAVLPGVSGLFRQLDLKVPAVSQYDGDFFGRRLRMGVDIVGVGVEAGYLADQLPPGSRFSSPREGGLAHDASANGEQTIPVVVSRRLLELYNTTFAPARGLPRIDASRLIGFRFPLTLGASYVTRTGRMPRRTVMLEVVGVSDRAMMLGVTFPLDVVRSWNSAMTSQTEAEEGHYSSVVLVADSPESARQLVAHVRGAGFDVDQTEARLAEEVGAAVRMTTLILSLLSFVILGLAALSIARAAYARVAARTREIGVMRAVGARKVDVASIILSESLAAGLVGGLLGMTAAFAATWGTDLVVGRLVADFPFKPESFFVFPAWLPVAGLGAALASAAGGAIMPALVAARLDPVGALSGGQR